MDEETPNRKSPLSGKCKQDSIYIYIHCIYIYMYVSRVCNDGLVSNQSVFQVIDIQIIPNYFYLNIGYKVVLHQFLFFVINNFF